MRSSTYFARENEYSWPLIRLKRPDRGLELDHRLRGIPHALEMRLELRYRASVADYNKVVVLRVLAARAEVSCAGPQSLPVDRVSLQVHERPAALDSHVVGQVAELDEVVPLAWIKNNPDNDAAVVSVVQGADDDRVGEGVGRQVDRTLSPASITSRRSSGEKWTSCARAEWVMRNKAPRVRAIVIASHARSRMSCFSSSIGSTF